MQADADATSGREAASSASVRPYVPPFLAIGAAQLSTWAGTIDARSRLSVLLRHLVHSASVELTAVDFPGFDNAERAGPDGTVESATASAWIPKGKSIWEFGTDANPTAKANHDYAARQSLPARERRAATFVFVTPRNWPGKKKWVEEKQRLRHWAAVRAYDASDLEQWLETSLAAQVWLAEQLETATPGVMTLRRCWTRWATACTPELPPSLFAPLIATHIKTLCEWMATPPEKPFVVTADSREEALAFLSVAFEDASIPLAKRDLPLVFDSIETLRRLAPSTAAFIPVVQSSDAARELVEGHRSRHCIIVQSRNASHGLPDIALEQLSWKEFAAALEPLGESTERIERLDRETGRSLTVLRRQRSTIPAINQPRWAAEPEYSTTLIPLALAGAWDSRNTADQELLRVLMGCTSYAEVERHVASLLRLDDSPVWAVGTHRGVCSVRDSLFAARAFVSRTNMENFVLAAEYLLSEVDPALTMPEKDRWTAALHNKLRAHSKAVREGMGEALVLLAAHGDELFGNGTGIEVAREVAHLVERLLGNWSLETLESQRGELSLYAEAAPDVLLRRVEEDLKSSDSVVRRLLTPVSSTFESPKRTGLLWALEVMAWSPTHLDRVVQVLAEMSRVTISDNWSNKPIQSLNEILLCWLPNTAASLSERIHSLKQLVGKFPDIGWQVCRAQLDTRTSTRTARPRWKSDALGVGQPTNREVWEFAKAAIELMLEWKSHDAGTLGDLIGLIGEIDAESRNRVWSFVTSWAASPSTTDEARALLRERIRRKVRQRPRDDGEDMQATAATNAMRELEPTDVVVRHAWLFKNAWVEHSADELATDYNHEQATERRERLRNDALRQIWKERGADGIADTWRRSDAGWLVGRMSFDIVERAADRQTLARTALHEVTQTSRADSFLSGLIEQDNDHSLLRALAGTESTRLRLFKCAPFNSRTWRFLEEFGDDEVTQFWSTVSPPWQRLRDGDAVNAVNRLLEHARPRAAFHVAKMDNWRELPTETIKRLIKDIAVSNEPSNHYRLERHDIPEALKQLADRQGVSSEEIAELELLHLEILDEHNGGFPHLARQLARSPDLYFQAIALSYRRDDGQEDSPDDRDQQTRDSMHRRLFTLLHDFRRIPGSDDERKIDEEALKRWIDAVRTLAAANARTRVTDSKIGDLLSNSPTDPADGGWPCRAVSEALDQVATDAIKSGFCTGKINSRGVVWRGRGGDQERELAADFDAWAQQRRDEFPFTARCLTELGDDYRRQAESYDKSDRLDARLRD